uniref:Uncharacterized protein n=1 Tax=Arundo donax TaxID=35708 RepID=A0A0A9C1K9_ARUDO
MSTDERRPSSESTAPCAVPAISLFP